MADTVAQGITNLLVEAAHASIVEHRASLAVRLCVLDTGGCGLAGLGTSLVAWLARVADAMGSGPVSLVGSDRRMSLAKAALLSGAAMHAQDFDDMHPAMYGHPSVAVLPGLEVLRSQRGLSDQRCAGAFMAGGGVACLMGRHLGPDHYDAGFHASATLGAIGAAAALANGLDAAKTRHALGLAVSGAAGLESLFGSMGKPVQIERDAGSGLRAALMAEAGITALPDAIDGPSGFTQTHSRAASRAAAMKGMGEHPFVTGTRIKRYPACYLTHSTIRACETLRVGQENCTRLQSIDITVDAVARDVCENRAPATGEALKFNLSGLAAMALSGAELSDPQFFDQWQPDHLRTTGFDDKVSVTFEAGFGYGVSLSGADYGGRRHKLEDFVFDDLRPVRRDIPAITAKFKACARHSPCRSLALLHIVSSGYDEFTTAIPRKNTDRGLPEMKASNYDTRH